MDIIKILHDLKCTGDLISDKVSVLERLDDEERYITLKILDLAISPNAFGVRSKDTNEITNLGILETLHLMEEVVRCDKKVTKAVKTAVEEHIGMYGGLIERIINKSLKIGIRYQMLQDIKELFRYEEIDTPSKVEEGIDTPSKVEEEIETTENICSINSIYYAYALNEDVRIISGTDERLSEYIRNIININLKPGEEILGFIKDNKLYVRDIISQNYMGDKQERLSYAKILCNNKHIVIEPHTLFRGDIVYEVLMKYVNEGKKGITAYKINCCYTKGGKNKDVHNIVQSGSMEMVVTNCYKGKAYHEGKLTNVTAEHTDSDGIVYTAEVTHMSNELMSLTTLLGDSITVRYKELLDIGNKQMRLLYPRIERS